MPCTPLSIPRVGLDRLGLDEVETAFPRQSMTSVGSVTPADGPRRTLEHLVARCDELRDLSFEHGG
jgi:hypothetical protein